MASVQVTSSDVLRHPHSAALVATNSDVCESDENSSIMSSSATTTPPPSLSRFERVLSIHPTIVESLLAQLPTRSLLDLHHTSRHLRAFLASYPLAWRTVSFRGPQPALGINQFDGDPAETHARNAKQYALDSLLIQVIVPFGTRLTSLDLCNTTVSGVRLVSRVLEPRVQTLQHLSVRGCKNVSIKYHLVPFLEPYIHSASPWANTSELALKSLYTYRCRHHRRRPYLPSSLMRRDSDSEPTHQLIEICHQLGIWTDTMWCTTPGGRCFRRKDYYSGRAAPGTNEVWVPFDRLWRSGNRIGPGSKTPSNHSDGRLWEDMETGQDGEPLGTAGGPFKGEGKDVPAHLRKSHRLFVEDVKCDQCNDPILERCEQCSIRMHCMGCRKTLCASCAFNRPIPRKRRRTNRDFTMQAFGQVNMSTTSLTHSPSSSIQNGDGEGMSRKNDRFWWAPGATRSPNLMSESTSDDDASDSDEIAVVTANPLTITTISTPPKLNMHWCCVEPVFSGGGGIVVLGPGVGGRGADRIRATPLPKGQQYEDPDFTSIFRSPDMIREMKNASLYEHVLGEQVDIVPYLMQESLDLQASSCPRSLCQDCYRTFRWRVQCKACKRPLCKEHDFRALKVRKCGYRELHVERDHVRAYAPPTKASSSVDLHIPPFVPPEQRALQSSPMAVTGSSDSFASSSGAEQQQQSLGDYVLLGHLALGDAALANSMSSLGHSEPSIRPRALSASDHRPSRSSSPWGKSRDAHSLAAKSQERERVRRMLPLPGSPRHPVQWRGCGAYFCQQLRPVGDCRPRCNAAMRECSACRVVVCDGCLDSNPPCKCAYCSTHYHCPTCASTPSVKKLCQRDAERAAAIKKKMEEEALRRMEAEALVRADEAAESVGQFFSNLFDVDSSIPAEWRDDLNRTEHIEVADDGARHRFVLPQIETMTSPDVLDSTGAATYAESSAMGAARAAAVAAAASTSTSASTTHKESTPDEIRDAVMQMLSNMDYATVGQVARRSLPSLDAAPHASSAQQPLEPQSATTETVAPGGVGVFGGSNVMVSSHGHGHGHMAGAAEGGGVMVPPSATTTTTASSSSSAHLHHHHHHQHHHHHHHHLSTAGSSSSVGDDGVGGDGEDDADDDTETDGEPHSSADDEAPGDDEDDVDVDDDSPVVSGSGSSAELISVEA